jgi:malto-oligosyltrehalose trehalohydrolase
VTGFEVWAPKAGRVDLALGARRLPMDPAAARAGWWELDVPGAGPGTDYAFSLDGGPARPDPRSRCQPRGVHGPSRVVDPALFTRPGTPGWGGRARAGSVVYEMHPGTFTREGDFDAAIGRLDHLADLGVNLVELMPVASFSGRHGWGYDGVALWAVHGPYGGPEGLCRFVDACHARGIGVLLDVVYNHLGPSGNYLAEFGPYFTDTHHTPWGPAVNLDAAGSDEVRAFLIGNALSWLRDYRLDGLRLDAVHTLVDTRALTLLEELSAAVDDLARGTGRELILIAESDLNDPRVITPRAEHGLGMHAQWSDDFHHALHSLLTGETQGYYTDFGSIAALAKTMTGAYFHDGTRSTFRGRAHGRPIDPAAVPGDRFVCFLQNHDQIGNRAQGDRISASLAPGLLRVGAALLLTAPFTPMLFMGEEWGASTPWQFFTDHPDPDLGRAVSEGRRREFSRHGWAAAEIPDPQDPQTVERSRLDWTEPAREPHRSLLAWYRALIALRRDRPDLADPDLTVVEVDYDEQARWLVVRRGRLRVVANLAARPQPIAVAEVEKVLLASADGVGVAGASQGDPAARTVSMPAQCVAILE